MCWDMLEMPRAGKSHGRVTSPPGSGEEPGCNSACAMNCQTGATPQRSYGDIRPWPCIGVFRHCVTGSLTTYSTLSQQPRGAVPQFPLCAAGSAPAPEGLGGPGGGGEAAGGARAGRLPSRLHFWVKPGRSSLHRDE